MHSLHSKPAKGVLRTLLPLVPLSVVVAASILLDGVPRTLTSASHVLAAPLWHVRDTVTLGIYAIEGDSLDLQALRAERDALQQERVRLKRLELRAHALEADNDSLRALIGRSEAEGGLLPAAVLAHSATHRYDHFIIDAGLDRGVRTGMLIRTGAGAALGFVSAVYDGTSLVTRFSAPDQETQAVVHGTSTLHTKLTGRGSGTMLVSIPRDVAIEIGEPVLAPGFGTIALGYVAGIDSKPEDPLQTVYVESAGNPASERFVLVDTMHVWRAPLAEDKEAEL